MSTPSPAIAINGGVSTGGGSSSNNALGAIASDYAQLIAPGSNAFQASGAKIFDMDAGILCLASPAQIGRVINGVKVTAETVAQNQLLLNAIGAYCRKNGISIHVEALLSNCKSDDWTYQWLAPSVVANLPITAVEDDREIDWQVANSPADLAKYAADEVAIVAQIAHAYPTVQIGAWVGGGPISATTAWWAAYDKAAAAAKLPGISYAVADTSWNTPWVTSPATWQAWLVSLSQQVQQNHMSLTVLVDGGQGGTNELWTAQAEQHAEMLATLGGVTVNTLLVRSWGFTRPDGVIPVNEPTTIGNAAAEIAATYSLYKDGTITAKYAASIAAVPQMIVTMNAATAVRPVSVTWTMADQSAGARIALVLIDQTGKLSAKASGHGTVSGVGTTQLILTGNSADIIAELATLTVTEPVAGPDSIDIEAFGINGRLSDSQISLLTLADTRVSTPTVQFGPTQAYTAASATIANHVITNISYKWNDPTASPETVGYNIIKKVSIHEPLADPGVVLVDGGPRQPAASPSSSSNALRLDSLFGGWTGSAYNPSRSLSTIGVLSTNLTYGSYTGKLQSITDNLAPSNPVSPIVGFTLPNYFAAGGTQVTQFNTGDNPNWQKSWSNLLTSVTTTYGSQNQILEQLYQGGASEPWFVLDNVFNPYTGKLWEQFETVQPPGQFSSFVTGNQLLTLFNTGDNPNWDYPDWGKAAQVTIRWQDYYATAVTNVAPVRTGLQSTDAYSASTIVPAAPGAPRLMAAPGAVALNTSNITNATTLTFTGTAAANTTIRLFDGATAIGTCLAGSTGTWSVTTAALAAGSHTITAKATDLYGNISAPSATLKVTTTPATPGIPDLLAASDSGASNTDNITNVTTPVFTGTSAANATVKLYDGTALIGTGLAGSFGTWSMTTSKLAAGTHTITAKTADSAGNLGAPSAAMSVTIDTAAPAMPSAPDLLVTSDSGTLNTDNITKVTTPGFTGTAEANATIQLFDGATVIGTGPVNSAGAWSVATSALAAGTHAITAKATDLAGNISVPSAVLPVTIDTATPAPGTPDLLAASDSGTSSTDNITNVTTPVFTGTAEANATVQLFDGTAIIGTCQANSTGVWSVTTGVLAAGTHTITAKATDLAGNISIPSAALTVTIDTIAPAVPGAPDLLSASDSGASNTDNVTNVTTPVFTGTAEANAPIRLFDGTAVVGTGLANSTGAWSVTTSALAAGSHAITAKALDAAGNISPASAALSITIDTAAPAAPGAPDLLAVSDSGVSNTDNITNVTTPVFTGTAEANATIRLFDGTTVVGAGLASTTGAWSVATSALTAGSHTITTKATDTAGNISTASTALSVTIDAAAPAAPGAPDLLASSDSGASSTDNITNVTSQVFTGTAEANATIQLFDGTNVIGTTIAGSGLSKGTGAWSVTATLLAAGPHAITARAMDPAGNLSTASTALSVTIDGAAPAAPGAPDLLAASDSGASSTDNITNVTMPVFTGTAEANATIRLFDGTAVVGTGLANSTGAWSVTTSALAAGSHAITAKALDAAGNISPASAALSITIDTAAPAAPGVPDLLAASDSGVSSTDNITSVTTPVFTGTAEANATIRLFDGTAVVGTGLASSTGAWSVATTVLATGSHAITAKAIDLAGNLSAASAALSVTIDTVAPTTAPGVPDLLAAFDSGASNTDNVTNVTTPPVFTGKADANTTVRLFDGITAVGTGLANSSGVWSVTTAALAAGPHAITARAMDPAGNLGPASAALSVTIDTAAPEAPTIPDLLSASDSGTSSTDNITNVTTPVFTGTAEANATIRLFDGTTIIGTGLASRTGAWSVTTSALASGIHAVTARAIDLAGNLSTPSAALSVAIDTAAPAAPAMTSVTTAAISGTAEVNSTITLFDGKTLVGSSVTSTGTWSMPIELKGGTHALTARATDTAGNISAPSPVLTAIVGTSEDDQLNGSQGADTMVGGAGDDTYLVNNVGDTVTELADEGTDTIHCTLNSYTLGANVGNLTFIGTGSFNGVGNALDNTIIGSAGNDTLDGGDGNDILLGGPGNDILIGGAGDDILIGGGGHDVFRYLAANFGTDTITDFSSNLGNAQDVIDISGLGITAANFTKSVTIGGGSSALITVAGGTIMLTGANQSAIDISDFKLALQ